MIPEEVLDQLRDIHTPPPGGFWPPAPGWWVVAILAVAGLLAMVILGWRRHRRQGPRRAALARLSSYPAPEQPGPEWYAGLNRLLKETALARYPADNPAGLSGAQWSRFLACTSGKPDAPWQALVIASYQPNAELDAREAKNLAEQWIRRQSW